MLGIVLIPPALRLSAVSVLERITDSIDLAQRLQAALEAAVETLAGLPAFERAVLERLDATNALLKAAGADIEAVRASSADLGESAQALVGALARVEVAVGDSVALDLRSVRGQLEGLIERVDGLSERLPDRDAQGPLAKAREVITGGG